ncbi:MAG: hypothetical protein R3D82_18990 [Xanthobacteraceae bacterium]
MLAPTDMTANCDIGVSRAGARRMAMVYPTNTSMPAVAHKSPGLKRRDAIVSGRPLVMISIAPSRQTEMPTMSDALAAWRRAIISHAATNAEAHP